MCLLKLILQIRRNRQYLPRGATFARLRRRNQRASRHSRPIPFVYDSSGHNYRHQASATQVCVLRISDTSKCRQQRDSLLRVASTYRSPSPVSTKSDSQIHIKVVLWMRACKIVVNLGHLDTCLDLLVCLQKRRCAVFRAPSNRVLRTWMEALNRRVFDLYVTWGGDAALVNGRTWMFVTTGQSATVCLCESTCVCLVQWQAPSAHLVGQLGSRGRRLPGRWLRRHQRGGAIAGGGSLRSGTRQRWSHGADRVRREGEAWWLSSNKMAQ